MNQYLKTGLLTLALIVATLVVPTTETPDSKSYVYGYPFSYVRQEKANDYKPGESVMFGDPRENPTTVVWLNLVGDLALVYGLLWFIRKQMKKTR